MVTGSEDTRADVVLLTALDLEYEAVRSHLTNIRPHVDHKGTRYETGEPPGGKCRIALAIAGHGTIAAATLTGRAVAYFQPKALVLVGVAGGLSGDVALGDVVVATRVHDYQGGRAENEIYLPRPKSWTLAHSLEQDARTVARDGAWTRLLPDGDIAPPKVLFKPIVSGDVVLDASTGHIAELIAKHFSDAVAIDMESAGVAEAAHHDDFYRTITVRAVSDRADGSKRTTDTNGWQQRAVVHAAAFAVALAERIAGTPDTTLPIGASPYRGLAAFGEDDAELFFGRTEATDEIAAWVSNRRFVTVVGRSGSGKSSLVHAGLVPTMRKRGWASAAFRPLPGVSAAVALAGGLLPLLRPDLDRTETLPHRTVLAELLAAGRLAEVVGDVLAATGAKRLLICVDQFEELVAWREEAAAELADLLVRLATGPSPVHVVLTVRTETLDVVVHRLGLGDVIGNSVFLLTPMNAEQLRAAIEKPIRSTGVEFEPGLVVRILEEARDAPAALTLMQFALTRLWEEQDDQRMTHLVYDGFFGIGGALASYAEQVWSENLNDGQRDDARRLLVQLVRPEADGFMRRTARGSELAPELVILAQHLATTRLLVTGTDAAGELTIDLAHSALARYWQRLGEWLTEERDFRAWQEDLRVSIRRSEPLRNARLGEALRWLRAHRHGISGTERDFILASQRRRRIRRVTWRGLLAVAVTLLLISTVLTANLNERTHELEDQLHRNAAQALVAHARERIGNNPDLGALLTVAAYRSSPEPTALNNLAGEYQRYRTTDQMLTPQVGQILDMAVSSDGNTAAVAGLAGAALLRLDQRPVMKQRYDKDVRRVALSQDGRLLATANDLGRIELHGQDGTHTVLRDGGPQADLPSVLRFDDRGAQLLATLPNSGLTVWDVARRVELNVPTAVKQAAQSSQSAWFGPDGKTIVVVSPQELTVWPLDGGPSVRVGSLREQSHTVVAGDGRTAITCTDGFLVYWDLIKRAERERTAIPDAPCPGPNQAAVDHHGHVVTAFSSPESGSHPRTAIWLVDTTADGPARVAVPNPAEPRATVAPWLVTTTTGARMITAVGTGVTVVNVPTTAFAPVNATGASSPLFSPDLRYAITLSPQPTQMIYLWRTATGEVLTSIPNPDGLVPRWFSSDGSRLVALDPQAEQVVILDVPSLQIISTADLPAEMKQNRARFPGRFNNSCVTDLPSSQEVAIAHAGLVIRLDIRSGTVLGKPLQLWQTDADLERLADTVSCQSRPNHNEIAFDVGPSVELWDLDRGYQATLPVDDIGKISSLRFNPDGRLLAVAGFAGQVDIWDVRRGQRIEKPRQVVEPNRGVDIKGFTGAGRIIVRGGVALRVWDIKQDAAIADVETAAPDSGAITPDGGTLLYWGQAGITEMPLDPEKWADHLCQIVDRDLTAAERQELPPGSPTGHIC